MLFAVHYKCRMTVADDLVRCPWGAEPEIYVRYHDEEWGRASTDDRALFEKVCLEGFQSGLAWITILRKRESFREAFAGFDQHEVASFGEADVARLLADPGIVRHEGKIRSTINNAARALETANEFGSLASYFWGWADEEDPVPTGDVAFTEVSTALPSKLMISAAVLAPPSGALRSLSLPASTLLITSFRSFNTTGWMPSSVAMRTITSLR